VRVQARVRERVGVSPSTHARSTWRRARKILPARIRRVRCDPVAKCRTMFNKLRRRLTFSREGSGLGAFRRFWA